MRELELADVQGIVLWGYGDKHDAAYLLLEIKDVHAAKQWLGQTHFTHAGTDAKPQARSNIAFTYRGFEKLGVHASTLAGFSLEFQDGMVTEQRSRMLGDVDDVAPSTWSWGAARNGGAVASDPSLHAILMLYVDGADALRTVVSRYTTELESNGFGVFPELPFGTTLTGRKEHFGFRDGIAQPAVRGARDGSAANTIPPGEIILGYENGYGRMTSSPQMNGEDFGRNGSYLVFRQLGQDVSAFWRFVSEKSVEVYGKDASGPIRLASKMVGRWPSGAPLVQAPDEDDPRLEDQDDFGYRRSDAHGLKCPFGSHIRRTNPRDWLLGEDGPASMRLSNLHRIIRRGRPYGAPLDDSLDIRKMLETIQNNVLSNDERGLHFLCFQASISRQFEFIQNTWVDNPKFAALSEDADPVIGRHRPANRELGEPTFTIPTGTARRCVAGLERFVRVRGGAYFFMPGIRAISALASS